MNGVTQLDLVLHVNATTAVSPPFVVCMQLPPSPSPSTATYSFNNQSSRIATTAPLTHTHPFTTTTAQTRTLVRATCRPRSLVLEPPIHTGIHSRKHNRAGPKVVLLGVALRKAVANGDIQRGPRRG